MKIIFTHPQCRLMERGDTRIAPVTAWGKALEALRARREQESGARYTQYQLAKTSGIPQSEYRNLLRRGVHGPSLMKVHVLIRAMGYTWKDWGIEYEAALSVDGHAESVKIPVMLMRKKKLKSASNE